MLKFLNKNKKKQKNGTKRTTQSTLPYIDCYRDGMMQVEPGRFSKMLSIPDISFKTQSDEDQQNIYENYQKLLNNINPGEDIFFTFVNQRQNVKETLDGVLPQQRGDQHDIFRKEISKMVRDKVVNGRNIKTSKYAVLRCDSDRASEAVKRLNAIEMDFTADYKRITKTSPKPVDLANRLKIMDTILNGNRTNPWFQIKSDRSWMMDYESMKKAGMTTKDVIAPEFMKFNGNNIQINEDRYAKVFYLESIAKWMNTNFISSLAELNCESCFTLHVEPIPQDEAIQMLHNQSVNINAEAIQKKDKSKSGYIPLDLQNALDETEDLQADLMNRNQKMFYMSLTLAVFADSEEELKEISKTIKKLAGQYLCRILPLIMQQERGLSSALPMGLDRTYGKRLFTTESLGVFIPFDEVNVFDEGGFYYGVNTVNKSLIVHNRLKGQNYNGLILGYSGSGKSFAAKQEMANVFLTSDSDIIVVDPDGEYTPLAEAFGGSVIKIAPGNGVYINPFDLDIDTSYDKDSNPIAIKTDLICGMLETMLGENAKLTPTQRAIVVTSVQQIYKPYLAHLAEMPPLSNGKRITIDRDYCPTMQNLFDNFMSQPQPEAQNLAIIMQPYITGTFDTFAHRTNVDLSNRFVVYDIKDIGSNLQELALKACTNDIWMRIMENRRVNKWTWFYIDEFHMLLSNDSTSKFMRMLWKRCRKYQGVLTGITQNVEDLLNSPAARSIINGSSFVYMLNQARMDRDMLAELIGLSDNDLEYITNADSGCGLIYTGKQTIPFTNRFPEDTELYKILSTKPKEAA